MRNRQRFRRTIALSQPPRFASPPFRRKCGLADAARSVVQSGGIDVESAAADRRDAVADSNSSQTSAKVSVYPSALRCCIVIGNSDQLQKDEKRPKLLA